MEHSTGLGHTSEMAQWHLRWPISKTRWSYCEYYRRFDVGCL